MLSTISDYFRFSQMLLNGGEVDGVRILSRKSIELMSSNHIDPSVNIGPARPDSASAWGWAFTIRPLPCCAR